MRQVHDGVSEALRARVGRRDERQELGHGVRGAEQQFLRARPVAVVPARPAVVRQRRVHVVGRRQVGVDHERVSADREPFVARAVGRRRAARRSLRVDRQQAAARGGPTATRGRQHDRHGRAAGRHFFFCFPRRTSYCYNMTMITVLLLLLLSLLLSRLRTI